MPLFSSPQSYLGIDFDVNSIKVVELKNERGRPLLVTYGYFDRKVDQAAAGENEIDYSQTAKLIRQVCRQAKATSAKAITALPAFSVFSSVLNLPAMPEKDLASAVKWEAKKIIPLPIEEMILDWKVLEGSSVQPPAEGEKESTEEASADEGDEFKKKGFLKITPSEQDKYAKILLTAASKDVVKRHIDIFKNAGLNLLSLDTEAFALIRSLVGNDKSALMIVDIGSSVTNISIVSEGIPVLNRSINVGGLAVTKAITASLNISLSQAEQFKYDIGMSAAKAGADAVPKIIETSLTPIVDELRYSLNLYKSSSQKDIEKIILTGGSSLLLNLPDHLSNLLGLRVFLGDPWARVICPEELKPVLDGVGPRFAVAIGLAMRDIE